MAGHFLLSDLTTQQLNELLKIFKDSKLSERQHS